jgi:hypothetical protein
MVGKEDPADAAHHSDGVSAASMIGKRSSAFAKGDVLADELQVVVAAHLGVAAEIHEVRDSADALEAAERRASTPVVASRW